MKERRLYKSDFAADLSVSLFTCAEFSKHLIKKKGEAR